MEIFGAVARPIQQFFQLEAASGLLLLGAAVVAIAWANSPAREAYHQIFTTPLTLGLANSVVRVSLHDVINEGLMTVFFFVVGMEIKRELVSGELRTLKRAMLPAVAALGGMAMPAAVFLAFNWGGSGQRGWGIPMATDIAFAIGCLTLLRKSVPHALIVFLTALAIFDDIGGILVIALFYGHGLEVWWLLGAAGVALVLSLMNRLYVRNWIAYALAGLALWFTFHESGIHATISGVLLGVMIPARSARPGREVLEDLREYTRGLLAAPDNAELERASILHISETLEDIEAPLDRFVHALHPAVAFVIMPLFALANSGVAMGTMSPGELAGPVALGTALGLVLGKPVGIVAASLLAVRMGLAELPRGVDWMRLLGVSIVAGIGFTVALFIAALAFPGDARLLDQAKVGILVGSLIAGVAGTIVLRLARRRSEPEQLPRNASRGN